LIDSTAAAPALLLLPAACLRAYARPACRHLCRNRSHPPRPTITAPAAGWHDK